MKTPPNPDEVRALTIEITQTVARRFDNDSRDPALHFDITFTAMTASLVNLVRSAGLSIEGREDLVNIIYHEVMKD